MHKILWLQSIVNEKPPPTFSNLYRYSRCLEELGPLESRDEQAEIVRAFVVQYRKSRSLRPPGVPHSSMTLSVMRHMMMELDPLARKGDLRSPEISRARARTGFKIEWFTGVLREELNSIRCGWIIPHRDGYILDMHSRFPHRRRTLPIPRLDDKLLCPATEIAAWLKRSPPSPESYLLPMIDRPTQQIHWDSPVNNNYWSAALALLLNSIGEPGYTLMTMRRSFLKRCLDQLGPVMTLYLSGLETAEQLRWTLRGEPDWPKAKSILT